MPHKQAMVFKYLKPLFMFFDIWIRGASVISQTSSPGQISVEDFDKKKPLYHKEARSAVSEKVICI